MYLVRCARCDRAFWQEDRGAPVPDHARWDRRSDRASEATDRCPGSERPGHWIAEGDGPLTSWPRRP